MRRAALLALALLAGPVHAATKHDASAPIDLDAATSDVEDKLGRVTFKGDVKVHQADLRLNSDQVKVYYKRKGGQPEIQRLDAAGHVKLDQPDQHATADYGVYDVVNRLVTLIGNVVLTQKQSVVRGQRLLVNLDSGRSVLDGRTAGGGTQGAPAQGGRVTGRFVVPQRKS